MSPVVSRTGWFGGDSHLLLERGPACGGAGELAFLGSTFLVTLSPCLQGQLCYVGRVLCAGEGSGSGSSLVCRRSASLGRATGAGTGAVRALPRSSLRFYLAESFPKAGFIASSHAWRFWPKTRL